MLTVDKWVTKLTADGRGSNELNYLKLLQYMMADRRIGRPFRRQPPAGCLLPLSTFMSLRSDGPATSDQPLLRARTVEVGTSGCWQTVSHDRTSQTNDSYYDNYNDDDKKDDVNDNTDDDNDKKNVDNDSKDDKRDDGKGKNGVDDEKKDDDKKNDNDYEDGPTIEGDDNKNIG